MTGRGPQTFETLVVGAGNRLAAAAARAVGEAPGRTYNPLFIYGGPGLGKTHLLSAIGALVRQAAPGLAVEYLATDEFVLRWHAAVRAGDRAGFDAWSDGVAVLLLDDVQFLADHLEAQAELLRLTQRMLERGGQVVLASDRPPQELERIDQRLLDRFAGGLVVDIAPPDYETRVAILRVAAAERSLAFESGVLEAVARLACTSVRELHGSLNRLAAHRALGFEPTPDEVPAIVGVAEPGARGAPDAASTPPTGGDEFAEFLSEVQSVVREQVDSWKVRLLALIARWEGEGVRTGVLERALELPDDPDVPSLAATFAKAVDHLRVLEARAAGVDPSLAGHPVFHDPERLAEAEDLVERALAGVGSPPGPSTTFTRHAFEVGASNQLAVHAADTVSAQPAVRYNPLVLFGPSGTGKTHLLHAIGNQLAARGVAVACVNAQQLIDELIEAIQGGSVARWRVRYRAAGALLVDDAQFLGGKERTQDEFFLVFNALTEAGRQVVLTSDRPPAEIPELEARLRSRFEGGLVVPLQAPDRELRARLFARFLQAAGHTVPEGLIARLAEPPVQSVREILGVVNRLEAAAALGGGVVDAAVVRATLGTPGGGIPAMPGFPAADVSGFLDREKLVVEWPDVVGRLIAEVR